LQLSDLSFELREGSLRSVTLKLEWSVPPQIKIELDGVELVFVPRKSAKKCETEKKQTTDHIEDSIESQNLESVDSDSGGLGYGGAYTYLPVQEGVRVVANLVESLLLGMHISVKNAIVAFQGAPKASQNKYSMLVLRFSYSEYSISYSSDQGGTQNGKGLLADGASLLLTNSISFEKMSLELLDIVNDENESSTSVAGNGRVFGQPASILQDDEDLSGCIQLSVPWKNGCLDILKLDADISISNINLQFTWHQIQQLMTVINSYGELNKDADIVCRQGCDGSEGIWNKDFLSMSRGHSDGMFTKEISACDPAMLQSKLSRSTILPGTKLISDWVHWVDPDKFNDEETMSEADFTAR
jgi:autophagy-related protein 2